MEHLLKELNSLIGLQSVKQSVREIADFQIANRKRKESGAKCKNDQTLHMLFTGNPGTGKTTVARLVGKIFKSIGILKKGTFKEVGRNDLVGQYIGHTSDKTTKVIESALDGVLFIDEAYALSRSHDEIDYGRETIDTLVPLMENYRDRLVVILAGYSDEMQSFLKANSGLSSRIAYKIEFPDYTGDDLFQIFLDMCQKNEWICPKDVQEKIHNILITAYRNRNKNFGNGRDVRNYYEKIIRQQSKRVVRDNLSTRQELTIFLTDDVPEWENNTSKLFEIPSNIVQPDILSASVSAALEFYKHYHDENKPIPPLILISPPVIAYDRFLHADQELSGIELKLTDNIRDFLTACYPIDDPTHPVKFLGGAINTKRVHSETSVEIIHQAFKSVPTRLLESQADDNMINLYLAQWDSMEPVYHYKKILSADWKNEDIQNFSESFSYVQNILIGWSVDSYYLFNYNNYPKLPEFLPELIPRISVEPIKFQLLNIINDKYKSLYQTLKHQYSEIIPQLAIDVALGFSYLADKSLAKDHLSYSMQSMLQLKGKIDRFSDSEALEKILSDITIGNHKYLRKLRHCLTAIGEYSDMADKADKISTHWSELKITGKVKRDESGDTLYVY